MTSGPSQHRVVLLGFKSRFPEAREKTELKMASVIASCGKEVPNSFLVFDGPETFSSFFLLTGRVSGHYDTVTVGQGDSVRTVA